MKAEIEAMKKKAEKPAPVGRPAKEKTNKSDKGGKEE